MQIVRYEIGAIAGLLFIFGALHNSKEPMTILWSQDLIFCRSISYTQAKLKSYIANGREEKYAFDSIRMCF